MNNNAFNNKVKIVKIYKNLLVFTKVYLNNPNKHSYRHNQTYSRNNMNLFQHWEIR
jgi:hypothetical protein